MAPGVGGQPPRPQLTLSRTTVALWVGGHRPQPPLTLSRPCSQKREHKHAQPLLSPTDTLQIYSCVAQTLMLFICQYYRCIESYRIVNIELSLR